MASFADDSESVGKLHRKPKVKLVKSYDGEWLHDKFHGRGVMYYHLTGARYEGEWARGRQNGWGTMFYPNGDRYEGEWLEGKRSGQGVIWLSNGDRYEGSWLNDVKNGSGKYHYNQLKRIYDGEWLQDVAKCGYLRDIASESSPIPPVSGYLLCVRPVKSVYYNLTD
jgi:hypothetical protein